MSIHLVDTTDAPQTSESATSSPAPTTDTNAPTSPSNYKPTTRVLTLAMKDMSNSQIMGELARLTNAYPVEPTPEEKEELREIEEYKARSARDSEMMTAVMARRRREKEILEAARGETIDASAA